MIGNFGKPMIPIIDWPIARVEAQSLSIAKVERTKTIDPSTDTICLNRELNPSKQSQPKPSGLKSSGLKSLGLGVREPQL